jgi:hypothetical protein
VPLVMGYSLVFKFLSMANELYHMTESKDPSLCRKLVFMNTMSMSEILSRILGGIIVSISILDIIFSTDFHFGYQ